MRGEVRVDVSFLLECAAKAAGVADVAHVVLVLEDEGVFFDHVNAYKRLKQVDRALDKYRFEYGVSCVEVARETSGLLAERRLLLNRMRQMRGEHRLELRVGEEEHAVTLQEVLNHVRAAPKRTVINRFGHAKRWDMWVTQLPTEHLDAILFMDAFVGESVKQPDAAAAVDGSTMSFDAVALLLMHAYVEVLDGVSGAYARELEIAVARRCGRDLAIADVREGTAHLSIDEQSEALDEFGRQRW